MQKANPDTHKIITKEVLKIAKSNLEPATIYKSIAAIELNFLAYWSSVRNPVIGNIKAADELKDVIETASALILKIYRMNAITRKEIIIPEEKLSLLMVAEHVRNITAVAREKEKLLRQEKSPPGRGLGKEEALVKCILEQYKKLSGKKPTLSAREGSVGSEAYDFVRSLYDALHINKNPEAVMRKILYRKRAKNAPD